MPRDLIRLALCVGVFGSFLLPPLAAIADERKPPEAEVLTNPGGEKGKNYWTLERMRNAKPVRSPVLDPETLEPIKPE